MASKKSRGLAQDNDTALFQDAIQDIAPLQHDRAAPFHQPRRPEPLPPAPEPRQTTPEEFLADMDIDTQEALLFVQPGIQKRLFKDLQRGRIQPADNLDLHGLRVKQARPIFARYLKQAHQRHLRCVRIIHGKSQSPEGNQPVLKQKTNQWLRQLPYVLAFCSAPPFDGGTGATYVLLSRKKDGD